VFKLRDEGSRFQNQIDKFKNFKNQSNNIKKVTPKDWSKINNKVNLICSCMNK